MIYLFFDVKNYILFNINKIYISNKRHIVYIHNYIGINVYPCSPSITSATAV